MTQADLDRAVALATGETVTEIKHLGFSLADPDRTEAVRFPSLPRTPGNALRPPTAI